MDHMNRSQHDEGFSERSLHNLIYCSLASPGMDPAEIHKIIATAKHHNPRFGITGLLVYGSGIFFQWLEGPKDNVTTLMKIIGDDPRHLNVVVLSEEDEIRERLFPRRLPCQVDSLKLETFRSNTLGRNAAGGTSPKDSCGRYSL